MNKVLSLIMFSNSGITKRLLITINLLSVIILAILAVTVINNTNRSLTGLMDSKIASVRSFLANINALNIMNDFKEDMEKSAMTTLRDGDFGYVGFLNKDKVTLYEEYDQKVDKATLNFTTEPVIDQDSKTKDVIGHVKIGQNPERIANEVTKTTTMIISIIVAGQAILSLFLLALARSISAPLTSSSSNLKSRERELNEISGHLLRTGKKLAESSQKQAAATQEGVATMEEMKSMIGRTNGFISDSKRLVLEVKGNTEQGDEVIKELISSMNLIQQANNQLQDIAGIIDDISNKTNIINDIVLKTQLLSFNASIEAARAGQHGKGFGVVAEEVGALAEVSGKAANEIEELLGRGQKQVTDIINTIGQRISNGEEVTNTAASIFQEVSSKVTRINDHITQISSAAEEQFSGVKQSSEALNLIDSVSKNTTEISQTAVSYSEQLNKLNKHIKAIMSSLDNVIFGQRG